jgi:ribosome biogenesis GTPase A
LVISQVALFGPVQSGKSSLVNTLLSAYREGRYVQVAHSAPAERSVTRLLHRYELALRTHAPAVLLYDTMGYA